MQLAETQRKRYTFEPWVFKVGDDERRSTAHAELEQARKRNAFAPVGVWDSDADICEKAQRRADALMDWVCDLAEPLTLEMVNAKLCALEAKPMVYQCNGQSLDVQLQGMVKRLGCHLYWRRQLRRAQVRKREAQAQAQGLICARGMPYVHDVTDKRYADRQAANRAMLEQTEIESADGETITLWAAAQAGTANKSIRRGELMTRIRGCEEWATAAGMVGIFTTNTLPSRFHSSLFGGGMNPNYQGATPRDGQQWLSATWARARAKIQREKIKVFGFRVAEPHHDGCPHWHMLLWVSAAQAMRLQAILHGCWLQHEGDEYGAAEYRFKAESIDPARGGAVAYVAKYIAKSIDDAGSVGTAGHYDEQGGQMELIEGGKARRVTAWASAWGIRQFQAIGQPPVTVWRELRRVEAGVVVGASKRLQSAHAAVHKDGDKRADWCAYMTAQGGAMTGRAYQLRLQFDTEEKQGRYGPAMVAKPAGVFDVARPGELCTSTRKAWKPKGTWSPEERHTATVGLFAEVAAAALAFGPTWTRFNNCTQARPARRPDRTNTYQDLTRSASKPAPLRH